MRCKLFILFILISCGHQVFPMILSLEEVEREALLQNYSFEASRDSYMAEKREAQEALTKYMPQINYSASARKLENPNLFFPQKKLYGSSIECSQLLLSADTLFDYRANVYSAKAAKGFMLQSGIETLTNARIAYYRIVLTKESVNIQEEEIALLKNKVTDEELKLKQGYNTNIDVLQSKVALAESLAKYYETLKNSKQAKIALLEILGRSVLDHRTFEIQDSEIAIDMYPDLVKLITLIQDSLKNQNIDTNELVDARIDQMKLAFTEGVIPANIKGDWINKALQNNPKVHVQKNLLKMGKSRVYQQAGKYIPQIAAKVSYNGPEGTGRTFSKLKYRWEFGVRLNWSLFDSFGRELGLSRKKYLLAKEKARFKEVKNQIASNIENQFSVFEESILRYFVAKEAVGLAEENISLAKLQKQEDLITTLDYLQIVKALRDVKHIFRESAFAILIAYFDLEKEMGSNIDKIKEITLK